MTTSWANTVNTPSSCRTKPSTCRTTYKSYSTSSWIWERTWSPPRYVALGYSTPPHPPDADGSWCAQVAKEASEKKCQAETLFIKDQLAGEQQAKESLENSLSAEIDYLREQLGLMRSVHTQLDEESSRKASLEVALQKTKQQLAEQQQFASESASVKVQLQSDSIKYFVACHQMSERNVAENLSHFLLCWFGLG